MLEEVSGQRITALRIVGGQSRSASWAQMQADILGKPVLIPPVTEASGWGAAMCAGLGVGYWSSLSEAVRVSTVGGMVKFEPQSDAAARYSVLYPAWVREVSPT
ncbi:MAG: hypothetical protein H0V00_15090 [Chloroflexia bacterium]|nr:hypothetical protein [Chloroflexia bacterium]